MTLTDCFQTPQRRGAYAAAHRRARTTFVLALALLLPVAAIAAGDPAPVAAPAAPAAGTTLPLEPTVTVDVSDKADAGNGPPRTKGGVPEADAIEQRALPGLHVVAYAGNARWQNWTVRTEVLPELLGQRVIARLMVAGFHKTEACPGHIWSGLQGTRRVDARVSGNVIEISLVPARTACFPVGGSAP